MKFFFRLILFSICFLPMRKIESTFIPKNLVQNTVRFDPLIQMIAFLGHHTQILSMSDYEISNIVFPYSFSYNSLQELIVKLKRSGDLRHLRKFWRSEGIAFIMNSESIAAQNFIKEYALLLLSLYQDILWKIDQKPETRVALLSFFSLYMKLKSVPLAELFSALDRCLEAYAEILEDYNFPYHQPFQIGRWLREYWYIPLVIAISGLWAWRQWRNRKKGCIRAHTQSRTSIFIEQYCQDSSSK